MSDSQAATKADNSMVGDQNHAAAQAKIRQVSPSVLRANGALNSVVAGIEYYLIEGPGADVRTHVF